MAYANQRGDSEHTDFNKVHLFDSGKTGMNHISTADVNNTPNDHSMSDQHKTQTSVDQTLRSDRDQ